MAMEFFKQLLKDDFAERKWREDCFRDELSSGIVIDTCRPTDTSRWETGIKQNGEWYVAEDYDSVKKAEEGHKEWVRVMAENPSYDLSTQDQEFLNKWLSTDPLSKMSEITERFGALASLVKTSPAKPKALSIQKR